MPDRQHNRRAISAVLADLREHAARDRVTLGDIVATFGGRAIALVILICALPNAVGLGMIPGVSTIFGLPQLFAGMQLAIGIERLWLPARLLRRSITGADLARVVDAAAPHLARIERVLRPRWLPLSSAVAERLLGLIVAILALIQALPIPFGNQPPAIAAALLAIGLIARDGWFVMLGLVVAVAAVAFLAGIVLGGATAVKAVTHRLFGG